MLFRSVLFLALLVFLAAIVSVVTMRFVMPWLSSKESLNRFALFRKANEEVTIINKTEQITVKEDYTVSKTAENILPSVASIITFPKQENAVINAGTIKSSKDIRENVKTGIVITSDGLIVSVMDEILKNSLTSSTADQNSFKVLMENGKEFDAKLKTIDLYSNLVF